MITTFTRKFDANKLHGTIISESSKFILLAIVFDLQFDGFQIIRKQDISGRAISESNKYCENLMRLEGMWLKNVPNWVKKLNMDSWESIYLAIKCKSVIIECEKDDHKFHIGSVIGVKKQSVLIREFNGVGIWQDVETVKYSKITTCKFLDRYSTIHAKHIKSAQQSDASETMT
jgi:hypothetical protein